MELIGEPDVHGFLIGGAALMTDTTFTSRVLGSAWPAHMNKALAETMYANIEAVGLPTWSEADVTLAKATQQELGVPVVGLATKIPALNSWRRPQEELDESSRAAALEAVVDIHTFDPDDLAGIAGSISGVTALIRSMDNSPPAAPRPRPPAQG